MFSFSRFVVLLALTFLGTTLVSEAQQTPRDKVKLGDPALTSGISGTGALTVEEIKSWLADERNHLVLSPSLPLGLSVGEKQLYIPEDNPMTRAKIELGRQLYFDRRLSVNNTVSCADCHHPDDSYGRGTRFGVGINGQMGGRNSPVSFNRILSKAQFWDGRAGSLEEQAIGPIANPIEMGNTHQNAVKTLMAIEGYRLQFDEIFEEGTTIQNVGKAIATFERTLVTLPSAYDLYEPVLSLRKAFGEDLDDLEALKEDDPVLFENYTSKLKQSQSNPMSESARRGREIFFTTKGRCSACHVGANLADEKYHNLGVGMEADEPDLGRFAVTKQQVDRGAFKTPTIRNVTLTGPYMHDGSMETLEEVVEWYAKGGFPNPTLSKDVKKLDLTVQDKNDLVAFMKACTSKLPKVEQDRLPK
ncbi:MAG: cytochrome-c peroxidase [Rhodopirellula sp.]|nr:cytochrome-c peroxidase [Rhodopirellula sp.]|tara:strand:- start:1578 stop:2828 length:1251 start_codon:yes stop_codon:yes gene_type:complete